MKLEPHEFRHALELYDDCDVNDNEPTDLISGMEELTRREDWRQSMEIPSVPEHKRPGTRATYLSERVKDVIAGGQLLITEEGRPFVYREELGCYRPVKQLEAYLNSFFPPQVAASIPVREYCDICKRLKWQPEITCCTDDFNPYTDWVNFSNGVFNLVTGKLEEHSKDFRFNYQIDAEYLENWEPEGEDDASCEAFNKFCRTSLENDPAKRKLLLEFIGYICTDKMEGKCALFLKGQPNSGKSVISNFIAQLFSPDMVSNIPLHQLGSRFSRAELAGRKLNVAGELAGRSLQDISFFKSVTGNDRVSGEFKRENPFYFTPHAKLLFAGNTLPLTVDADATSAYVNRIRVLLFNSSVKVPDKNLPEDLWKERNYIVTLAMNAVRQLIERNYAFTEPADSREFLDAFALRGNVLGAFLDECCILEPKARVFNKELYAAFNLFCERNGIEPMKRNKFYDLLAGIPHVSARKLRIGNENRQGHLGLALKEACRFGTLEQTP